MVPGFDFYGNALGKKRLKDGRIRPLQIPSAFDRKQAVLAWNDIGQVEGSIRIALVAAALQSLGLINRATIPTMKSRSFALFALFTLTAAISLAEIRSVDILSSIG